MPFEENGKKYENAALIIERMVKASKKSQTRFAKEILGIEGTNLSKAKKDKKIPERWFDVVRDRLSITKDELCRELQTASDKSKTSKVAEPGNAYSAGPTGRRKELVIRFKYLFDFLEETYEDNQVGVESFAAKLEQFLMTEPDYRLWKHLKEDELREALKKRGGGNVVPGPLSKVSNSSE
ncbi:hypothetical protein [Desulfobulbus elongatus]|uniref:hypothetical protein n=1 Tax=Desulfobulbus elongatus TaxID=53332 RepID=UPI0004811367|nr:hypothetical protein [Desulfobulbus elongatus]